MAPPACLVGRPFKRIPPYLNAVLSRPSAHCGDVDAYLPGQIAHCALFDDVFVVDPVRIDHWSAVLGRIADLNPVLAG